MDAEADCSQGEESETQDSTQPSDNEIIDNSSQPNDNPCFHRQIDRQAATKRSCAEHDDDQQPQSKRKAFTETPEPQVEAPVIAPDVTVKLQKDANKRLLSYFEQRIKEQNALRLSCRAVEMHVYTGMEEHDSKFETNIALKCNKAVKAVCPDKVTEWLLRDFTKAEDVFFETMPYEKWTCLCGEPGAQLLRVTNTSQSKMWHHLFAGLCKTCESVVYDKFDSTEWNHETENVEAGSRYFKANHSCSKLLKLS